jgi:hypothetical protein
MSQFILKITLGNDAMQTDEDIVYALQEAAKDIHKCFDLFGSDGKPIPPNHYPVRDRNGNKVGYYEVE